MGNGDNIRMEDARLDSVWTSLNAIHHLHPHHHFKSFFPCSARVALFPQLNEHFYSYECCNSIGVLKRFVFTGWMPFLTPNQAHQVCKE